MFKLEKHVSQTLEVASIAGGLLFGQLGTKGVASNAGGLLFAQLGTKGVVSTAAGFFLHGWEKSYTKSTSHIIFSIMFNPKKHVSQNFWFHAQA